MISRGITPLGHAVSENKDAAIKLLIFSGACITNNDAREIDAVSRIFHEPLLVDLVDGKEKEVSILLRNPDSRYSPEILNSALVIAASRAFGKTVATLHELFNDSFNRECLEKAIWGACLVGSTATVKLLVSYVMPLDDKWLACLGDGLVLAAAHGHHGVIDLLFEIYSMSQEAILKAFSGACRQGSLDNAQVLYRAGDREHYYDQWNTALNQGILSAAVHGHVDIVRYILRIDHTWNLALNVHAVGDRLHALLQNPDLGASVVKRYKHILGIILKYAQSRQIEA